MHILETIKCKDFIVNRNNFVLWDCIPTLVSYCPKTTEARNVSVVIHGLEIVRPCHRSVAKITYFNTMHRRDMRHRLHISHDRRVVSSCRKKIGEFKKAGDLSQV